MAVLNKIRQQSVILIVIIALALFSFVLADLIRNGGFTSQKSQNVIATVNGEEIGREEFAQKVEAYTRNARGNMSTTQAVNRAWDVTIRQALLEEQFEELGLEVGQEQINQQLRQQLSGNPTFSNEAGMFDMAKVEEYVRNLKETSPQAYEQWKQNEKSIAEQAKSTIYYNMIRAGVAATLAEGEEAYKLENNTVNFKYVLMPYADMADVEVTKADIKDYLKEHKERFQTEASRDIQYVYFEEKASTEDEEAVKTELSKLLNDQVVYNEVSQMKDTVQGFKNTNDMDVFLSEYSDQATQERYFFKNDLPAENAEAIYQLNEGELFGPYKEGEFWKVTKVTGVKQVADSVKAKDILISYKGTGISPDITRTKEEAKQLADSLLNVINTDSEKFASIVTEYSNDSTTKEKEGDLGWVMYNQVNQENEVVDFLFTHDAGERGIIDTEAGYYIMEVTEATEKEKAVKVATLAKQIEPSEKTTSNLYTEATKFQLAADEGDFTSVAEEKSLEVRPVRGLKSMQENIPGVGNQRQIVQWTFDEESKVGDIKRFDIPSGYVIAQLTAKHDEGLMSVEEASAQVTEEIRNKKKAEQLKAKISGSDLASIAQSQNAQVQTASAINMKNPTIPGATREPKVVGAAFSLENGEMSKPIAGKKGVYVLELISKKEATPLPNYRGIAAQETKKRTNQAVQRLNAALKKSAEIEDNRAKFY